jgi:hypothetical protein
MSFGMPMPHQFSQDPAANLTAGEAAARLSQTHGQVAEERLERLLLVSLALWELLRERTGLTEADLLAKVAEIDVRDGILDGKLRFPPIPCPNCNRPVYPRHHTCLYCGTKLPAETPFAAV